MKKILSLLVLSSLMICPVTNAYAKDGQTNITKEVQQKGVNSFELIIPNLEKGERLQVSKGSTLDMYGITHMAIGTPVALANDMVSNFDNTKLGDQDVIITDYYTRSSTTLPITVIDGQAPGEIKSIKAQREETIVPLNVDSIFIYLPYVDLYDAKGRYVRTAGLELDGFPHYDTSKLGKQKIAIEYKGIKTYITLNVVETCAITTPQSIPVGGKINTEEMVKIVDVNNPENIVWSLPIYVCDMNQSENPNDAWYNKIDTSKPGKQTIEFEFSSMGQKYTATIDVNVGMLQEGTLSEEAKKTIPTKNEEIGVWKLPLSSYGKGEWLFDTGLEKGSKVDAFSYYNNKWLKLGTFIVDENGSVVIEFTDKELEIIEEQLELISTQDETNFADEYISILLAKSDDTVNNDKDSEDGTISDGDKDSTDGTTSGSDKDSSSSSDKKATSKVKSLLSKTGDKAGIALYGTIAIAGIAGIAYVLYTKKKRA